MAAATSQGGPIGQQIFTGDHKSVITLAESNNLKIKAGKVSHVVVWAVGTTATIDIYDHASSNTNPVWSWVTATGLGTFALQIPMTNGIRVVAGGTPASFTVVWS